MKTTRSKITALTSAVALALLLAAANATALTNSVSASAAAPVAKTLPAKTTLTPAAAVSSPVSPAGEDIRDIRQPRHLPAPWFWVVAVAGVAAILAALGLWFWLRRNRIASLLPHELALQRLEEARRVMDPEHAREYCFAASKIIRGYLEEQLHLRAPRLTTEEFLRELVEGQEQIVQSHRELLGDFLQHCDLAKFAGWRYTQESLTDMHASAIAFVQQSAAAPAALPKPVIPIMASVPVSKEFQPANAERILS